MKFKPQKDFAGFWGRPYFGFWFGYFFVERILLTVFKKENIIYK